MLRYEIVSKCLFKGFRGLLNRKKFQFTVTIQIALCCLVRDFLRKACLSNEKK